MKKVSLLLILTLILMLVFTSCDILEQLSGHEHAFDEYYSYDSETHYFACTCGAVDQVEDHIDESGDGLCDVCEYEMYVPTIAYVVSITAGEGVSVEKTSYEVEEENDLTFTVKVGSDYTLTVSGAKIIGDPVVEDGVATYTVKVIYVVSDVDVTLNCELIQLPCEHVWAPASCDAAETCTLCGETNGIALGHTYTARVVAPGCTEAGYTAHVCSRCGDSYNTDEVAALGHVESEILAVAPGCETVGFTAGAKCTVCNEILVAPEEVSAAGHTEMNIPAVAPDCVNTGLSTGVKCSVCDKVLEEPTVIDALGHTEVADAYVAPTCEDTGLTAGKHCSVCNEILVAQVVIEALGHVEVVDAGNAPNCTESGLTDGKHCSVCDKVTVAQTVIDALGHKYNTVVTAPTCTEAGYTTYTCENCGDSYVGDNVAALTHNYNAVVTPATCTAGGFTTYTCTRCDDSYVSDETVALTHNYNAVVTAPTCTAGGFTTYTCTFCADSYVGNEVEASGHNWKEATCTTPQVCLDCKTRGESAKGHDYADATCTEPSTCKNCGNKKGSALGHAWVNATCDTPKTCSVCHITEGEVAPHNYVAVVKKPTCLDGGYTTYTCSKCSDSYVADITEAAGHKGGVATCEADGVCTVCNEVYLDAIGHNYIDTIVPATCTEDGYTTHKCANCNRSYVDNKVDALGHGGGTATCTSGAVCEACGVEYINAIGHNYEPTVTAPTCTEEGYTTHTCLNCGDSYTSSNVAAKGHDETAVVTEPTCLAGGYTTYTCATCGNVEDRDQVDALGHNEVVDAAVDPTCEEVGRTEGKHCDRCKEILVAPEEIEALGHTEVVDEAVEPTCAVDGLTEGKHCATCKEVLVAQDVVPATGEHDWNYDEDGKLWQCTTCNGIEHELVFGENIFALSTGTGFDVYGYATTNDITVRFVATEAGEYYITSESGMLAVNGQLVENGEKYAFTIAEDNLEIILTLGVRARAENRNYYVDAIVEKVQNKPDAPGAEGKTVSGETDENGECGIELTLDAGTYEFVIDADGEYNIFVIGDGIEVELVCGGTVELPAGDYLIGVVYNPYTAFILTYTNLSAGAIGETVSGETDENGECGIELTLDAGTYEFVIDADGEYNIFVIGDGIEVELVCGGTVELPAGDYLIGVVYKPYTEFTLNYTMLSGGVTADENPFTLTEEASEYNLVVTEAGNYTFTVKEINFDITDSILIGDDPLTFNEVIYLEADTYVILASVGDGEYVTIEYTFEAA